MSSLSARRSTYWSGYTDWISASPSAPAYISKLALISAAYYIIACAGLPFSIDGTGLPYMWPSGFTIAVTFLFGASVIPAIVVGSLLANLTVLGNSQFQSIAFAGIDVMEGLIATYFLTKDKFVPPIARVREALVYLLFTAGIAVVCANLLRTLIFVPINESSIVSLTNRFISSWTAGTAAALSIGPFIFSWVLPATHLFRQRKLGALLWLEILGVFLLTLGIAWSSWVFALQTDELVPIKYFLFPILIWAALRLGQRGSSLVIITTGITASVWAFLYTTGSELQTGDLKLASLRTFLCVLAISGLFLAAVAEERTTAYRKLNNSKRGLENSVARRTEELVRGTSLLETVLDNVPSVIIAVDRAGNIVRSNPAAYSLYGLLKTYKGGASWGQDFHLFRSDGKTPLLEEEMPISRALKGETVANFQLAAIADDLTLRYFVASAQPLDISKHGISGAILVAHDITEQKHANDLQILLHKATVTANEAPDPHQAVLSIMEVVCVYTGWSFAHAFLVEEYKGRVAARSTRWWYNSNETYISVSEAATDHRFYEGDDLPGRVLMSCKPEWFQVATESTNSRLKRWGLPSVATALAFPVMANSSMVAIVEFFSVNEVEPDFQLLDTMSFVFTQLGRVYEREAATQEILDLTLRDPLTGIPNRLGFDNILQRNIRLSQRQSNYKFAVLFLDLDSFKGINDQFGHAAGDEVISTVAYRIKKCLRNRDAVARFGGDEFTVLLENLGGETDVTDASVVAFRIAKSIEEPIKLSDNKLLHVTASIGVVHSKPHYTKPDMILRDADSAMYQAKALGKSCVIVFEHETY